MDIDVRSGKEEKQLFKLLDSYGFKIYSIGRELKLVKKVNGAIKEIYATKV